MSTKSDTRLRKLAKNHYREDEYFALNVKSGIIRNPAGTRMLGIPADLFAGLHAGLEEETGSASGVVLHACGKWWGERFWKRHAAEVRKFYGTDLTDMSVHVQQKLMRRIFALLGWGLVETNFDLMEKGYLEVVVENAVYSEVVGNLGRTTDHLFAGVLSSIMSDLAGRQLDCIEIACRSKGDASCAFLVGLESRVRVADAWVKQGRTRAQILEQLTSSEPA